MVRYLTSLLCGLFLLGWNATISAQHLHQCGVSAEEGNMIKNRMLENRKRAAFLNDIYSNARNSTIYIPVQFHIVTKTDGSGGESLEDVLANLCKLNDDFAFMNVEFYLANPVAYINQSLLYDNDYNGMANYFLSTYKQPNVVNIFVGNSIVSSNGNTLLGYYSRNLDVIYAIKSSVNGHSFTLTHEVGHFFSLPHTFNGWEELDYEDVMANTTGRTPSILPDGDVVENIVRTGGEENCQIAADGFCDTEANYLFGFYRAKYNTGPNFCEYVGSGIDPTGKLFRPDLVAEDPVRFKMQEDNSNITEFIMQNNFIRDYMPKTLIVTQANFTPNSGNPVTMWQDTIGKDENTDFHVPANGSDNIIGTGAKDLQPGFITMGAYSLDQNISTTTPGISFNTTPAEYSVTPLQTPSHTTTMASLEIINNTNAPITGGITITVEELLNHAISGQVSSETWTINYTSTIPANATVSVPSSQLTIQKATIAGGVFSMRQYAPYQTVHGTTSGNIMSYYDDACLNSFSTEQGNAMQLDIASRGLVGQYSPSSSQIITTQATVTYPSAGITTPNNWVNFSWNAISGATTYIVHIYEINALGHPLLNGEVHEVLVNAPATTLTLALGEQKNFKWEVMPINDISFCDSSTISAPVKFTTGLSTSIQATQKVVESAKIYPNPLTQSNLVTIELQASKTSQVTVNLVNSLGQIVMPSLTLDLVQGLNKHQLNTGDLPVGLYLLNINGLEGSQSHKLTIKR